ncbi:hypothetical protein V6N13_055408 [Hibiscus sabdariffa]|uniref:Secreted protein n=2 Tax=Hibiscus sabdariffa TaxID=183260 RepID=A0ABR2NTQ0_9ROSI
MRCCILLMKRLRSCSPFEVTLLVIVQPRLEGQPAHTDPLTEPVDLLVSTSFPHAPPEPLCESLMAHKGLVIRRLLLYYS